MKILYFDCFSGISGDMTLGAFIDCGVTAEFLIGELKKIDLPDYHIEVKQVKKRGIMGTHVDVIIDQEQHAHRHYSDIKEMIESSSLASEVQKTALRIFKRIAAAEAKVHGTTPEKVHFHEVGAIDSIVDVVGASICYHHLQPDKTFVSPINVGSGTLHCAHGVLPVPAPATAEIITASELCVYARGADGETATPTGVAIAAELATPVAELPKMRVTAQGYGFGTKEFEVLNALRIYLGEDSADQSEDIWMVETNIDDMSGEVAGYVLEGLFALGARDAFYTPIYMKKNRPAFMLSVLCEASDCQEIEAFIFTETTTIGLRKYPVKRCTMERHIRKVTTAWGEARIKVCRYGELEKQAPEYEDLRKIAKLSGKPYLEILRMIEGEL